MSSANVPPAGSRHTRTVFTIGHSTRSLESFVGALQTADIRRLVDVRSVPRSRRHPQFNADALAQSLPEAGIEYLHEKDLGGFRRPAADSPNGGWEHPAFQGYADYMRTKQFEPALCRLQAQAFEKATCIMCAEAQWWRCHRRLISDALVSQGWNVLHLGLSGEPVPHELTSFAVLESGNRLVYPPGQTELPLDLG